MLMQTRRLFPRYNFGNPFCLFPMNNFGDASGILFSNFAKSEIKFSQFSYFPALSHHEILKWTLLPTDFFIIN